MNLLLVENHKINQKMLSNRASQGEFRKNLLSWASFPARGRVTDLQHDGAFMRNGKWQGIWGHKAKNPLMFRKGLSNAMEVVYVD